MKRVLTIAGSDSSAGAGIQADLRVFAAHGLYGLAAVTAVTAQNTTGVKASLEISVEFVAAQIDAVMSDIGAEAAKTGLLPSPEAVALVSAKVVQHGLGRLVVDPVLRSSSGQSLAAEGVVPALRERLIPLACLVTPNLAEAEALTGTRVATLEQMREAAVRICRLGARYVLVKGGHLAGDPIDVLFDGTAFREYHAARVPGRGVRGTGCTLSAAIAAQLALGKPVAEAVGLAKDYVTKAISTALFLGEGYGLMAP